MLANHAKRRFTMLSTSEKSPSALIVRILGLIAVIALLIFTFTNPTRNAHAAAIAHSSQIIHTSAQAHLPGPIAATIPSVSGCYYVTLRSATYPFQQTQSYNDIVTMYLFGYYNNNTGAPCNYMFSSAWVCRPAHFSGTGTLSAQMIALPSWRESINSITVGPNTTGSQQCSVVNNINQPQATSCGRAIAEYYIPGDEDVIAPQDFNETCE